MQNFKADRLLEVHHIFPKAQLYKLDHKRAEVNALANFCFQTKQTNLEISDRFPEEYFAEFEKRHPGALATQWIPMDTELWKMKNYRDFLEARKELLAAEANKRMEELLHGETHWLEGAAARKPLSTPVALVDGIKYQRLGDEHFYAQQLFETEELTGYLKNLVQDTTKSVYEHVVYDSTVERDFAEALERNEAIKVYAKLPGWFKVPTPLGTYNPDWAVLVERDGQERLYFVVETKSSLFEDDLRDLESGKIKCGAAHFRALAVGENPAVYGKFRDLDGVLAHHDQTLE